MVDNLIPPGPFGDRVRRRLYDEQVVWSTTVGADGTPQPNPVWSVWDGEDSVLIYNHHEAKRLARLGSHPQVALHFNHDAGGDIVVLEGSAEPAEDLPPPQEHADYLVKYGDGMVKVSGSLEAFGAAYSAHDNHFSQPWHQ